LIKSAYTRYEIAHDVVLDTAKVCVTHALVVRQTTTGADHGLQMG